MKDRRRPRPLGYDYALEHGLDLDAGDLVQSRLLEPAK
jgi:hypothetical protein